jgi:NTE family protein
VSLSESDVVVGTSAGAVVGAWLTMQPNDLHTLPERMRARAAWHAANAAAGRGDRSLMARIAEGAGSTLSVAQAAVAAIPPISADQAAALWTAALPVATWPRQLRIVSVNAGTGDARVWSAADGLSLAVAVACSTAAPGAAPPVAVADGVWVDGGVRSGTNADLLDSDGSDGSKVLVVAPMPSDDTAREEAILVRRGHDVRVIIAEPFYQQPTDLLDPRFIDAAVSAGERQARDVAADLRTWWGR